MRDLVFCRTRHLHNPDERLSTGICASDAIYIPASTNAAVETRQYLSPSFANGPAVLWSIQRLLERPQAAYKNAADLPVIAPINAFRGLLSKIRNPSRSV